jgi:hypothetical protein
MQAPRAGHLQSGQSASAQKHGRACLALAAIPTRHCSCAVVHRAGRRDPRPHPQDHRRCPGQEVAGRPVALRHNRAGTRGRAPQAKRDLNDEVRQAPPSGASCRAGVVRDRSSTGFNKPSPKMGPTTPSRPALNEASWWEPHVPPDTSDAAGPSLPLPGSPPLNRRPGTQPTCRNASYESSSGPTAMRRPYWDTAGIPGHAEIFEFPIDPALIVLTMRRIGTAGVGRWSGSVVVALKARACG